MRTQALGAGLVAQSQSAVPPFRLHRPAGVAEACALVAAHPEATIGAGCSDLVARLREGERVERLISLQRVRELGEISVDDTGLLRIGAMVTHHAGSTDPVVQSVIPALARAWSAIATVRIRYTGTIGGNIMAGRHRYEMPLMLGALDARTEHDATGRLLLGVHIDTADLVYFGYERSMRPTTTLALAVRRPRPGSLTVAAVSGSEYRAGYRLDTEVAAEGVRDLDTESVAADLAAQLSDDCADYTGSADYRRHLVEVLASRLLRNAQEESQS